ncbi:UDP-4-amino-4,6-dideoxy-N-acetyl-beta-L-altrosamine transaminase [Nesterenkonia sp. MY13]|uniref:UDP-4-amino-4, 6-dideoxy-N-acetyl-beta-L-altrosamine transaminase n=1 Tax=Nesterenkonia sedimenti TaxID=1463632 RepID=A0A7X8TM09_9MICC|nr:UDP-4-amino-4,6-dideoxy-N-acetyl-beta-L-altrosamine transaminase [Nesterenkonia sedimenti]NLS11059.1 UDP-4-amino-4,6-dideoxy-N-acetyl-beta-L-altrosamine transaminase [Nesterenkonia sedimenti]
MIPYGRQDVRQEDIESVIEVLRSDFLTQGPKVPAFERAVAEKVGATHGIAVNSATSALHIACKALGVASGDILWTTPNTFVASANCALYCGADVDFVDIDARTYNLSVEALRAKLRESADNGRLPKVLVAVHFAGQPCDMEQIRDLSNQYGFRIIEDASHAVGGKYQDEYVGSGNFSDVTIFSFHPVKIVTTAEGGLALTNDESLAQSMRLFRSHGVTRAPEQLQQEPPGPWYYEQVELGFNYRMTDLQAALGLSQLERLDEYVSRRHELADLYDSLLEGFPVTRPYRASQRYSGLHLYPIRIDPSHDRRKVFEGLREREIGVNVHYIPVHTQPWYRARGFGWGDFPAAEEYYREAISLPMYPSMSDQQVEQVVAALEEALALK